MSSDAAPPLGEWLIGLAEPAMLMAWAMRRKCLPPSDNLSILRWKIFPLSFELRRVLLSPWIHPSFC